MRYLSPQFMMPQCDVISGLKFCFVSNRCAIEVKHQLVFQSLAPTCCHFFEILLLVGQLVHPCADFCPLSLPRLSAADFLVAIIFLN